jgi:hypothetical protein
MRLDPACRNDDMSTGLQARIYDPLWLLARQWQIGEFDGDDAGSPAMARFRAETSGLTRFHPGSIAPKTRLKAAAYSGADIPLETLVEREVVRPAEAASTRAEKLRLAIESGMHFLRLLDQQAMSRSYRDSFVQEYSLPLLTDDQRAEIDAESLGLLNLMARRVPDGRQLYFSIKLGEDGDFIFPPDLGIAAGDMAEVEHALRLWRRWYETLFDEPAPGESCWVPERMEYAFSVAGKLSDEEVPLTAREYAGGTLDWHDFDANFEVNIGAADDNVIKQITSTTIPAPVSFRGAPAQRFWEFEDAQVDFGSVKAGPEDLARMILIEFAVSYGSDWFVIPVELPVGSICRSQPLIITNTFGERFLIPSSHNAGDQFAAWRMFQLSLLEEPDQPPSVSDIFFMPPVLISNLDSRPIEEVQFLRDEMANMAWAVEHIVESAIEQPLNRLEQQQYPAPAPVAQADADKVFYKLATRVPDNWIPLLPVRSTAGLRLQRGRMLEIEGIPKLTESHGRILNPDGVQQGPLQIFEEEVPREGLRVTRHYQLARWQDGSTHLWIGRKKQIGKGEGSSGLQFDRLNPGK